MFGAIAYPNIWIGCQLNIAALGRMAGARLSPSCRKRLTNGGRGTLALPLPPFVSRFLHEGHVLTQYSRSAAALSLWTLSRLATLRNPGHTAAHRPTETIISGKIDGVFLSDNQRIMYAMFWFEIFLHTVSENHIAAL